MLLNTAITYSDMTIKILTMNDMPELKNLIGPGPQKIGFSDTYISNDDFFDYMKTCISHSLHKTYGYYDGEELVSLITLCDFPGLPYYALINFKVIKKFNVWSPEQNGMKQFLEVYFNKEKEERYSFFMMRGFKNARLARHVSRQVRLSMGELWDRYHETVEEYIPAGSMSKWEPFNKILFRGHTFNDDSVLYKFTCKQEYRTNLPEAMQSISTRPLTDLNRR